MPALRKNLWDQIEELLATAWIKDPGFYAPLGNRYAEVQSLNPMPGFEFPKRPNPDAPYSEEIFKLAIDLKQNGMRQPIFITADNIVLDGLKRVSAIRLIPLNGMLRQFAVKQLAGAFNYYSEAEIRNLVGQSNAGRFDQTTAEGVDAYVAKTRRGPATVKPLNVPFREFHAKSIRK